MVMRIFCTPGKDAILITPPTYGMYTVSATVNDVAVQRALLTPDFDVDYDLVRPLRPMRPPRLHSHLFYPLCPRS